jgi:hypothetical protein
MVEIHAELKRLSGPMHDVVQLPYTKGVLHAVEAEEKVFHLCHYGEKLAIAFGLINTAPGTPLQIIKICGFVKIATLPQSSIQK